MPSPGVAVDRPTPDAVRYVQTFLSALEPDERDGLRMYPTQMCGCVVIDRTSDVRWELAVDRDGVPEIGFGGVEAPGVKIVPQQPDDAARSLRRYRDTYSD